LPREHFLQDTEAQQTTTWAIKEAATHVLVFAHEDGVPHGSFFTFEYTVAVYTSPSS
jgi:hypothetical protein